MNDHWKSIQGWFDFQDIYDEAIELLQNKDIAVEVGTWLGKSTCYFANKLKESKKTVDFYACDLFTVPKYRGKWIFEGNNFYREFIRNLRKQGVLDYVFPIIGNSLDISKTFGNDSITFLFIDDNHAPDHIKIELSMWFGKVKKGGIIAGHDSYAYLDVLQEFMDSKNQTYEIIKDSFICRKV